MGELKASVAEMRGKKAEERKRNRLPRRSAICPICRLPRNRRKPAPQPGSKGFPSSFLRLRNENFPTVGLPAVKSGRSRRKSRFLETATQISREPVCLSFLRLFSTLPVLSVVSFIAAIITRPIVKFCLFHSPRPPIFQKK